MGWGPDQGGDGKNHCQVLTRERCSWWGKIGAGQCHWDLKYISKLEEGGDSWFNAFLMGNKLGLLKFLVT